MRVLHKHNCCFCGEEIDTYWEDNEDGTTEGMLRGEDHCLVGAWVVHLKCLDKTYENDWVVHPKCMDKMYENL